MMVVNNSLPYPLTFYQRGFTLFESLVVICVMISLMQIGARYVADNLDQSVNQVVAQQLQQLTKATEYCVKDHYAQYLEETSITLDELIKKGYLMSHFQKTNLYNQNYQIKIIPDSQQIPLLKIMIMTQGGRSISEKSMRQIVNLLGPEGGFASHLHPNKIIGNQGGWELTEHSISAGHLANLAILSQQDIMDTGFFLRRTKFTGHPEYNKMETDLQLDKNVQLICNSGFSLGENRLTYQGRTGSINLQGENNLGGFLEIKNPNNTIGLYPDRVQFLSGESTFILQGNVEDGGALEIENKKYKMKLKSGSLKFIHKDNSIELISDDRGGFFRIENALNKMELFADRLEITDKNKNKKSVVGHND